MRKSKQAAAGSLNLNRRTEIRYTHFLEALYCSSGEVASSEDSGDRTKPVYRSN